MEKSDESLSQIRSPWSTQKNEALNEKACQLIPLACLYRQVWHTTPLRHAVRELVEPRGDRLSSTLETRN
jgi:hypothetical protein